MMKSKVVIFILIGFILYSGCVLNAETTIKKERYPYQDSQLPVEKRVADLLSRMSLEEKVRQMDMYDAEHFFDGNSFSTQNADSLWGKLGAGSMHVRGFQSNTVELCNKAQKYIIENSRWGIPILFLEEALHGAFTKGSTVFPIPLALAATWNPALVKSVGNVIASESRAHGVAMGLGPVLGLAREPRWGRVEETYGEDPCLVSEIALAMVTGMQGTELSSDHSIIAEPKHFAVYSQPEAGVNCSAVSVDEREARSSFFMPFEKTIQVGNARAVMSAYSEWQGIPCTGNQWLLTDLLRNEWGFDGMVVTDLGAIAQLRTTHHVAASESDAICQAVSAGVDMQFYDFPNEVFQKELIELVNKNELPVSAVDRAVSSILRNKFMLGLFEHPYTDKKLAAKRNHTKANQQLALQVAQEAICLLKNDNNLLPLKKEIKTIAVLGPNSNDALLTGGYTQEKATVMTVLEGIKKVAGSDVTILHENGIPVVMKGIAVPAELLWLPDLSGNGLTGEYFNNLDLEEEPALKKQDDKIDFNWGVEAPAETIEKDNFSIRWTGYLMPREDFSGWLGISSDDGSRLYIDDQLVIDHWQSGTNIYKYPMELKANQKYKIKLEYRDTGWGAHVSLRWNFNAYQIEEAVAKAEQADIAIVVVGENESIVGENKDRASLDLFGSQLEFVQEIYKTGTPVVVVLINGRPISIPWIEENVPAILEAWFPGEFGGLAVANVLFGNSNPAGRLPITFPYSVGQSPVYYYQKTSSHHRNEDEQAFPLYPFGYGLSYSIYEYSNLKLSAAELKADETLAMTLNLKNTGTFDGDEVVQLYVRDMISSVTKPGMQLKAFKRVPTKAGETVTVQLNLNMADLALWNRDMKRIVEPGEFRIMIGSSSRDIQLWSKISVIE